MIHVNGKSHDVESLNQYQETSHTANDEADRVIH